MGRRTSMVAPAIALALLLAARANGDFASDRSECVDQLTALLPCLPFVESEARMPIPDCCTSAKAVVGRSFKCLCLLVKDRNEPGLGFKINVTRAVTLPAACNVPANISDCPKLLKLQPGSPMAQEFNQLQQQIVQNFQAKTKSNNIVDARNNITSSNPSGSSISKRRFIGDINVVLQLGFLFMVFLLWGN
ncbi:protein YLS3 isoform X1 [Dendrobium catenatum]|uniref:protein YLS3 isoform X1 n=1 Tax=Dendrobium catenatum TaxID=906689 RepID=UPI00109FC6F5|nr:protein YLS3 isoform X1 [Dendrobium catenatum]